MELLKTDLLKKEFERFQNKILVNVLECGLCQKTSCEWDKKFFIGCDRCRKVRCQPCISFNIAKDNLLKNLDNEGREYIENFIKDFLNLSNVNLTKKLTKVKIN